MSQPTVVVVDAGGAGDGEANAAPPAGPAYVTEGELSARLELTETRLRESIESAVSTAWRAQEAAESAQDAALTAAAVAADAAAAVDEVVVDDQGDDTADSESDGGGGDVESVPQPPERRAPAPAVQRASAPRRMSYGASWLSGR